MSFRNQDGLSMIEVLVAVASLGLLIYSFAEVSNLRSSVLGRVKVSSDLSEVMMANVNEVKWRDFAFLPKAGDCLARVYDKWGTFVSQTTLTGAAASCGKGPLAPERMEIYWRVSGPSAINATFSPSNFLKLPKYKTSIVQIEIVGRRLAPPPGPPEITLDAVVFRK
jgi:hypothetical protein